MKLGTTISSVAHVGILLWGTLSLQNVKTFEVVDVEALPVDFIPIESITQSIKGDPKANREEEPAPAPTKSSQIIEPAENVGDTKFDEKSEVKAEPKLKPVEASPPPPKVTEPEPAPVAKLEPDAQKTEVETPVPTTEMASLNEPPAPIDQEKIEEAPAKAEEAQKAEIPPKNVPLPIRRPRPPAPKTAKTQKRKNPDEIKRAKKKASAKEKEKAADDRIAALLNKQDPVATGKKRSTSPASLGSENSNVATKLSRSEMDALRSAIEQCWNVPIGLSDAQDMRVTITMNLANDGTVDGRVNVEATGGESNARRAFAESARRAVLKCAPYDLPNEKYDTWSQVVVNFDPSQMF